MGYLSFLGWLIPTRKTFKSLNYFGSATYFFSTGLLSAIILEAVGERYFRYALYGFMALCAIKCLQRLAQATNGISFRDVPFISSFLSHFSPPRRLVATVKIIGRLCSSVFFAGAFLLGLVTAMAGLNTGDKVVLYLGAFTGFFGFLKMLQRIGQSISIDEGARKRKTAR